MVSLLFAAPVAGHAQTPSSLSFQGVQITVSPDGLFFPSGTAVDARGNTFIADTGHGKVLKMPVGGGTRIEVASSLSYPTGIAVNAAGDIFISDSGNNRLVKAPAGGGHLVEVATGLCYPGAVALDGAGDVFVADNCNNRVLEIAAGSGSQTEVGSGFSQPGGVAVDAAGNVFVADTGNSRVVEIPAGGGSQFEVASQLGSPLGVAVDAAGNVFIADRSESNILVAPKAGAVFTVGSGLSSPSAVVIDSAGNPFVADTYNNRVIELQLSSVNLGTSKIGAASAPFTLPYTATAGVTLGALSVLTQGAPNLDFTVDPSSTCSGTLSLGDSCTVVVKFKPEYAGPRTGAVTLSDDSGNILTSTNVYGLGSGAQLALETGTQLVVPAAVLGPEAIAGDGFGNIYIADTDNSVVFKYSPGGGQTGVGSGLSYPTSLAVDGAGNVYIADNGNSRIVKVTPSGIQTTASNTFTSSVALDSAGNLFAGSGSTISRVAPDGTQTAIISGLAGLSAFAMDGKGNFYVAGQGVLKITPDGTQTSLGSNWRSPAGIAVDAAGDVFVADSGAPAVVEVSPYGGPSNVGSGYTSPTGIAVDPSGNIYVADRFAVYTTGNSVVTFPRGVAPTIQFADTVLGQTSMDSPRSFFLANIGNATFRRNTITLSDATDFALGYGDGSVHCASVSSYLPGNGCSISVSFKPQSARHFSKSVIVKGNAGSGNVAVYLSGSGLKQDQTITFEPVSDQSAASTASLSASSDSGLTVTFTSNTPSTCSVSGTTVTFLGHGRCSIKASQAGNAVYNRASISENLGVHRAEQTITFGVLSDQPTGSSIALTASATSGLPVTFVSTTPTACSVSGSTANLLRRGRCFLKAMQPGDAAYVPASIVSQSFNITATP